MIIRFIPIFKGYQWLVPLLGNVNPPKVPKSLDYPSIIFLCLNSIFTPFSDVLSPEWDELINIDKKINELGFGEMFFLLLQSTSTYLSQALENQKRVLESS